MGAEGALGPCSFTATGALPPFKTDVIVLCTEFYHLGEGAHFASCYTNNMGHSILPPYLKSSSSAYDNGLLSVSLCSGYLNHSYLHFFMDNQLEMYSRGYYNS